MEVGLFSSAFFSNSPWVGKLENFFSLHKIVQHKNNKLAKRQGLAERNTILNVLIKCQRCLFKQKSRQILILNCASFHPSFQKVTMFLDTF